MNDLSRLENASSAVRRATENLVKAAQVTVTVILLTLILKSLTNTQLTKCCFRYI